MIKETFNLIKEDLSSNNYENINQVINFTKKVNQYNNFCRRAYVKQRISDNKLIYRWEFLVKILYIQYSLLHLYETLDKDKPQKISKKTTKTFALIQELFDKLYSAFSKNEIKIIQEINTGAIDCLYNDIHKQMRTSQGTETLILYYFGELTRLINLINTPLIALIHK